MTSIPVSTLKQLPTACVPGKSSDSLTCQASTAKRQVSRPPHFFLPLHKNLQYERRTTTHPQRPRNIQTLEPQNSRISTSISKYKRRTSQTQRKHHVYRTDVSLILSGVLRGRFLAVKGRRFGLHFTDMCIASLLSSLMASRYDMADDEKEL